jgi:hypothetical protein
MALMSSICFSIYCKSTLSCKVNVFISIYNIFIQIFSKKISDKNKTPLKILSAGFHIPLSLRRGVRGEVL